MNMFKPTDAKTPEEYIELLDEPRKAQIREIHEFIKKTVPSLNPYIQHGMIGYGKRHYKYASGREGDWFVVGLASQKSYISVYSCATWKGAYLAETYKGRMGEKSVGKSCIRFKKIEDIEWKVLEEVLRESARIDKEVGIFSES